MIIQSAKPTEASAPAATAIARRPPVLNFVEPERITKSIRMLIIGEQGTGKTLLASSILELEHIEGVLYIDVDRGLLTASQYIDAFKEKIHVVRVSDSDPVGDMTKFLRWLDFATDRTKAEAAGIPYVNAVIIDSVSFLADKTIAKLANVPNSVATGGAVRSASQPEWGNQKTYIESWIHTISEMPCHLIVTCHQFLTRNEQTQVWMPQLILPGKLGFKLPALFDEVFWLAVEQQPIDPKEGKGEKRPVRVLLCQAEGRKEDGKREAKDRSQKLPSTITNPTMEVLFKHFYR